MIVHGILRMQGPRLFLGGPAHGKTLECEDRERVLYLKPLEGKGLTEGDPVGLGTMNDETTEYRKRGFLTIFETAVPAYIHELIWNDTRAIIDALRATDYAVFLRGHAT